LTEIPRIELDEIVEPVCGDRLMLRIERSRDGCGGLRRPAPWSIAVVVKPIGKYIFEMGARQRCTKSTNTIEEVTVPQLLLKLGATETSRLHSFHQRTPPQACVFNMD
jgi:hypothetical protein